MPNKADIVLASVTAIGDLTMVPTASTAVGVSAWVGNDDRPVGQAVMTHSVRDISDNRKRARVTLSVPVVQTETLNGVETVKQTDMDSVNIEFTFGKSSDLVRRKAILDYVESLLDGASTFRTGALEANRGFY